MNAEPAPLLPGEHHHVFLGAGHEANERRAWAVIALCSAMMILEIGGGLIFGSLALVADGLHMSTHAAALLIAALAYTYARRHAADGRFVFGTGKLGDLAGFTSAIVLAMIALLIGFEAVWRFTHPVHIDFGQAIPIAILGLMVNIASAWLLSGGHEHHHGHAPDEAHNHGEESRTVQTSYGRVALSIFESGSPPHFRLSGEVISRPAFVAANNVISVETVRPGGARQNFQLRWQGRLWQSADVIPEPHEFKALLSLGPPGAANSFEVAFVEHDHSHAGDGNAAHRDHNLRAAFIHVLGDAFVSVLAILGLSAGLYLGWAFMDPVMGMIGALVIAAWAYSLVRATSRILLDINPDATMANKIRSIVEAQGDRVADLHLWRLGPGHFAAILSVVSNEAGAVDYYHNRLRQFATLSHITVEVLSPAPTGS
ncbi:MAG TPA: CDF family Co(II)/Ni(II) efflux transporter DmeF [Steroidobacteraceae bacterium]